MLGLKGPTCSAVAASLEIWLVTVIALFLELPLIQNYRPKLIMNTRIKSLRSCLVDTKPVCSAVLPEQHCNSITFLFYSVYITVLQTDAAELQG